MNYFGPTFGAYLSSLLRGTARNLLDFHWKFQFETEMETYFGIRGL